MATFPTSPINYGALKVSFPANLPRNEKDLICMLLAGRLKDLWNGKLVCAQLAIDDLIKDLTGVSALKSLRDGLTKLKGSVDDFKRASGYDKILGGVNQAMGQISNVFSLGGLCPSPVTPPKIPDVLATLNQNLFGQANGILNALAQASNPKVCLGGGPKGFSLDWSKVTGDLKVLKNAIAEFKKNPAGFNTTMKAFESNISNQAKRLNSELKRLEKNLTDPLGINEKRNTASNVKRSKAVSDGFEIKDRDGVVYKNPTRTMIPGEIEYVLSRTEPRYVTPVSYVTKPVYDYCGNLTGYIREVITGDPEYAGYDTYFTQLNIPRPTVNPGATYEEYDFLFKEENGQIKVYDTNANVITDLNIQRGRHYRIGIQLITKTLIIGNGVTPWVPGITVTKEPDYGSGFETTQVEGPFNSSTVELDWSVKIENPTTPNLLTWTASNGQTGNINISGSTSLPESDKTYDTSMAAKKAWLNVVHLNESVPTGGTVKHESRYKKRKYKVITKIVKDSGDVIEIKDSDPESIINYNQGLKVIKDKENFLSDDPIEGGKILILSQLIPSRYYPGNTPRYFIMKKFVNDDAGMQINQISCYITDGTPANITNPLYIEPLASLKFDKPVTLLNDVRLPHTDYNDYKLSIGSNGKLNDNEENKLEVINYNGKKYLSFNLSSNRKLPSTGDLPVNSFVVSSYIELDPGDQVRNFTTLDPVEKQSYHCFKGPNGFLVECEITYLEDIPAENSITTQVKNRPNGYYLPPSSYTVPEYSLEQLKYQDPFRPVIINGSRPPYVYSITPALPPGLIFDVDTGTIRGTPTEQQDRIKYKVSIDEEDVNLYYKEFYIKINPPGSSASSGASSSTTTGPNAPALDVNGFLPLSSGAVAAGFSGGPGVDTVIGGSGPTEIPPRLLDPNDEYYRNADGFVWAKDNADPTGQERWYFISPEAGYITTGFQQVDPTWNKDEQTWQWANGASANTPGVGVGVDLTPAPLPF